MTGAPAAASESDPSRRTFPFPPETKDGNQCKLMWERREAQFVRPSRLTAFFFPCKILASKSNKTRRQFPSIRRPTLLLSTTSSQSTHTIIPFLSLLLCFRFLRISAPDEPSSSLFLALRNRNLLRFSPLRRHTLAPKLACALFLVRIFLNWLLLLLHITCSVSALPANQALASHAFR